MRGAFDICERKVLKPAFAERGGTFFICFFLDSPAGYVCMYVCCPGRFSIFAILT